MPQVEQLVGQRFRVRSRFGLVVRVLGLAFVGLGVWIGVTPLFFNLADWMLGHVTTSAMIECLPGTLIGFVIGVPMLCVGWAMAFLRHSFEIDLVEESVTDVKDLLVWKIQKQYPLKEVKSVLLNSTARRGKDTTSYFVNALVATKAELVTVVSEPAHREHEVREVASQLAKLMGVMLEDNISHN